MKSSIAPIGLAIAAIIGVISTGVCADGTPSPAQATVKELMTRDLAGIPGKELRMSTVEYIPAGAAHPHRHNAQVFVYVLEGTLRMQIEGSPVVTLGPGDTFYEGPDDVHSIAANVSQTKPAKILVFMVKDKNQPVSIAVPPKS